MVCKWIAGRIKVGQLVPVLTGKMQLTKTYRLLSFEIWYELHFTFHTRDSFLLVPKSANI